MFQDGIAAGHGTQTGNGEYHDQHPDLNVMALVHGPYPSRVEPHRRLKDHPMFGADNEHRNGSAGFAEVVDPMEFISLWLTDPDYDRV
jgi:hypothetical protein